MNFNFRKYLPFLEWIPMLKDKDTLYSDIIAWITVALILVPQSMAYAWLAWLPLEMWLYTAFIPVIVWALFGSSYQMSTGPVTIVSLMTATALWPIAASWTEWYILYASLLALFIWMFYILLGVLKLWIIVDFLSHPVIVSFTNAIAIITITSQLPKIFWVTINSESCNGSCWYFKGIWLTLEAGFTWPHAATLIFWIFSIILLVALAKYAPKVPGVLVLLVVSIIVSSILEQYNLWVKIVWDISNKLPWFSVPFFSHYMWFLDFGQLVDLWMMAMVIWIIGFTESISVAKFVWTQTKQKVSANRELIWQGLANISSWLTWWFWVAWSFSKTAVNMRSWAITGLSSVVTGIVVLITLLYFTKFLYNLPVATLAAIIIVAVFSLIKIEPLMKVWEIDKQEGTIAILTFILTLMLTPNVEWWIVVWVALSLWLFVFRSMRPKLAETSMYKDWELRDVDVFWLRKSKHISILRFESNLYFANAGHFESSILDHIADKTKIKFLILNMELVNNIDYTGQETLENLIERLEEWWINVYLTNLRTRVIEKLSKNKFIKKFKEQHLFTGVEDALERIRKKYWDKIDLLPLEEFKPARWKKPELEKEVLKDIVDASKDEEVNENEEKKTKRNWNTKKDS